MNDRLTAFFFGRRAASVLIASALGVASLALLGGCEVRYSEREVHIAEAPSDEKPSKPRPVGALAVYNAIPADMPSGLNRTFIMTIPSTGCEFIVTTGGGISPNTARDANGVERHNGCRINTYRVRPAS
ncbi:hypothetical protein KIKIMORA_00830 [Brevundimonas phage vB_BpoS-Kikimora]|uniref:Uncharacterized protein n=1 Tax=Brevundimonas phage vB_BpoS-Kikimora TaxID=2948601 RepID=A0A9E7MSE1_9CAUD|nr:hypothetical protein KIKIMORA_00830 [Brevundimonas phage vB_BpoS-Kikimora]